MSDDLVRLEEWFGHILHAFSPAERRRAAMKLGRALRKANLARIAANVQPDGTPMEPKKARLDRRGRVRAAAGAKMFQGLRYAKHWTIDAQPDGLELRPTSALAACFGAVNHYGETTTVGRLRNGKRIRTKYPERRLLGVSDEDEQLVMDIAGEMVEPWGV